MYLKHSSHLQSRRYPKTIILSFSQYKRLRFNPWVRKIPGGGNGNPLQYPCLKNPIDRGLTVPRVTESDTTKWRSTGDSMRIDWLYESESRSVVSISLLLHGLYSPWNSPGQNTGVGSLSLLQGIFPTQGSNPDLLHCRRILYQLSHKKRRWDVSKPTGHALQFGRPGFNPWVGNISWRRERLPIPVFWPGEFTKSQTWLFP